MEKNSPKILLFIVLLAVFLRFFQLGTNPPALTWDEASWGYNAYSLGTDGKDEFGRFLPLDYLESFGDFKPPLYAYLTILPVKIFGLNELATRFASAFFGSLTVLITYFLVKQIFSLEKQKIPIALASSFFLAISPWHINLSRAAFEANAASFFLILGIYLFFKAVNEKIWYLVYSGISFVLTLYSFNTSRVVAPLIVLTLTVVFYRKLLQKKKEVAVAIIISFILSLPFLKFALTPQAALRFQEVNIFSDLNLVKNTNQAMQNDALYFQTNGIPWWSKIIHNRRLAFFLEYAKHYLDHFSPQFLFIRGDVNPKFSTQDTGQLYLWDLPFLVIGAFLLIRKKFGYGWFVLIWLLIGIIPAATARETPHALRIETTLPAWQITISVGLVGFLYYLKKLRIRRQLKNTAYFFLSFILMINVLFYLNGYYFHYAAEYSGEWQYGYKLAVGFAKDQVANFDNVLVTQELGRPYIYFLFYTKENPEYFRKSARITREAYGFVHVDAYGKYKFVKNLNEDYRLSGKTLYLDTANNIPSNAKILNTFYLLNGAKTLVAYTL